MELRKSLIKPAWTLIIFLMFILLAPLKVEASVDIHQIDIDVILNEDGSASFTEEWQVTNTDKTELYKPLELENSQSLRDFRVAMNGQDFQDLGSDWDIDWSFDEKAYTYGQNGDELNWGLSERGQNTYQLNYTITNFVAQTTSYQMIFWQFINDSMDPAPENFTIRLRNSRQPFNLDDNRLWAFGFDGSARIQDGEIQATNEAGGRINQAVLLIRLPDGQFPTDFVITDRYFDSFVAQAFEGSEYDIDQYDPNATSADLTVDSGNGFPAWLFIAILASLGLILIVGIVYTVRQERLMNQYYPRMKKLEKHLEGQYYRQPPGDNVFQSYHLLQDLMEGEGVRENFFTAAVLALIYYGALTPQSQAKEGLFRRGETISFRLNPEAEIPEALNEALELFEKAQNQPGDIITEKNLERAIAGNYKLYSSLFRRMNLYSRDYMKAEGYLKSLNAEEVEVTMDEATDLDKAHSIAFKRQRPVLSQAGFEFRDNLVKFKNYLQDFSLISERQVQEVQIWDALMIYAAAFGIADEVEEQLQELYPSYQEATVYRGIPMTYYYVYASHMDQHYVQNDPQFRAASGGGGASSFGGGGGSFGGGSGGGAR